MPRILYADESYKITGVCFETHNELGRFARERQYADKFEEKLKKLKIPFEREYELKNLQSDSPEGNRVDFLIFGRILTDFKAKRVITKEDYIQMQRYLKAANLELGLIVNFRAAFLKPKRVLNANYDSDNSDANSGHSDRE